MDPDCEAAINASLACRRDPRDASLALRIGAALVATHDFEGAVSYYEKAVNANRGNVELQLELAGLLARVGRGRAAQQMLQPFRCDEVTQCMAMNLLANSTSPHLFHPHLSHPHLSVARSLQGRPGLRGGHAGTGQGAVYSV